jgi:hypothetical protein
MENRQLSDLIPPADQEVKPFFLNLEEVVESLQDDGFPWITIYDLSALYIRMFKEELEEYFREKRSTNKDDVIEMRLRQAGIALEANQIPGEFDLIYLAARNYARLMELITEDFLLHRVEDESRQKAEAVDRERVLIEFNEYVTDGYQEMRTRLAQRENQILGFTFVTDYDPDKVRYWSTKTLKISKNIGAVNYSNGAYIGLNSEGNSIKRAELRLDKVRIAVNMILHEAGHGDALRASGASNPYREVLNIWRTEIYLHKPNEIQGPYNQFKAAAIELEKLLVEMKTAHPELTDEIEGAALLATTTGKVSGEQVGTLANKTPIRSLETLIQELNGTELSRLFNGVTEENFSHFKSEADNQGT